MAPVYIVGLLLGQYGTSLYSRTYWKNMVPIYTVGLLLGQHGTSLYSGTVIGTTWCQFM